MPRWRRPGKAEATSAERLAGASVLNRDASDALICGGQAAAHSRFDRRRIRVPDPVPGQENPRAMRRKRVGVDARALRTAANRGAFINDRAGMVRQRAAELRGHLCGHRLGKRPGSTLQRLIPLFAWAWSLPRNELGWNSCSLPLYFCL